MGKDLHAGWEGEFVKSENQDMCLVSKTNQKVKMDLRIIVTSARTTDNYFYEQPFVSFRSKWKISFFKLAKKYTSINLE